MRFERLILAMGPLVAMSFGSAALAAIDPLDAMSVCARINKKDARLECYDQVAEDAASGRLQRTGGATSSAPLTAAPPSWATPPGGALAQGPRQSTAPAAGGFGSETIQRSGAERRETEGPEAIKAEVASSTDNGLGQWRMKLADGALWQMTERVPLFRPPTPHEVVTIKKAALGGFMMDVGSQASVRVRRVQ